MKIRPAKKLTAKDFEWTQWSAADIKKRTKEIITVIKEEHEKILKKPAEKHTFETLFGSSTKKSIKAGRDIEGIGILPYVSPKKAVRAAAQKSMQDIQEVSVSLAHDKRMYELVKAWKPSKEEKLRPEDKKLWKDALKGYQRMGFDLPQEQQDRLKEIKNEMLKISQEFKKNLYEHDLHILCTKEELEGLSEEYISTLKKVKGKYKITLSYPDYIPFVRKAKNHEKRKEIIDLDAVEGGKENLTLIKKSLGLRKEKAQLLGFKTYAEYVLEDTLAKNTKNVHKLIDGLYKVSSKYIDTDIQKLTDIKQKIWKKKSKPKYFERAYLANTYKETTFGIDSELVKQHFVLDVVMENLFEIIEKTFGITMKETNKIPTWHDDVKMYHATDIKTGSYLGLVGFDLFPRKDKYNHAMSVEMMSGGEVTYKGEKLYPRCAIIVMNVAKPTKKTPSLLSHSDVTTLFHEFGHALHSLSFVGSHGSQAHTSTDFIEIPSQILEEWAWDSSIIKKMSMHYKTGEALSQETIDAMISSRYLFRAMRVAGSVPFMKFDMQAHGEGIPGALHTYYKKLDKQYIPQLEMSPKSLFPSNMGHIMNSLYYAQYYSYQWSLSGVYDCFAKFKEKKSIMNKSVGMKFRKEVLAPGSSRPEAESLKKFLGREMNPNAYAEFLKKVLKK